MLLGLTVLISIGWTGGVQAQTVTDEPDRTTNPAAAGQFELAVPVIGFGTEIDSQSRELVGEAEEFSADVEKIYCLTRITGAEVDTEVTHAWYHEGKTKAKVILRVGSASWRTYSSKRILPSWTGQWEVKVLDQNGVVLATAGFTIR